MFAHAFVPWSALVRVLQGERLRKLCFGECKSKLNLSYMIDHAVSVFKPVAFHERNFFFSFFLHLYSLQKYFANYKEIVCYTRSSRTHRK